MSCYHYPMRHYDARVDWDVQEMLRLRQEGWSYPRLGSKYGRDHTTIMYHCLREGLVGIHAQKKAKDYVVAVPKPDVEKKRRLEESKRLDIEEMFELRRQGWNYPALSEKFGICKEVIFAHCKKNHLTTKELLAAGVVMHKKRPPLYRGLQDDGEQINPGKSYAEYLQEALKRPTEAAYGHHIGFDMLQTTKDSLEMT